MGAPDAHRAGRKPTARGAAEHRASARSYAPRTRHPREPTYARVRLEVDLGHEVITPAGIPFLGEIRAFLRERKIAEEGNLLHLEAALLHALEACGFDRVDHWEIYPGGWLPLPEAVHPGLVEPVEHLVRALASDRWQEIAGAVSFSVRLSADTDRRVDAVLRRVHRERQHSLSLELYGRLAPHDVHRTVHALQERLPVLRAQVTSTTPA